MLNFQCRISHCNFITNKDFVVGGDTLTNQNMLFQFLVPLLEPKISQSVALLCSSMSPSSVVVSASSNMNSTRDNLISFFAMSLGAMVLCSLKTESGGSSFCDRIMFIGDRKWRFFFVPIIFIQMIVYNDYYSFDRAFAVVFLWFVEVHPHSRAFVQHCRVLEASCLGAYNVLDSPCRKVLEMSVEQFLIFHRSL